MYKEYTKMVEKTVKEFSCDTDGCGFTTTHNSGCCGQAPVMVCDFCDKHACGKHRESYYEGYDDDYPKFTACDNCRTTASRAFELAKEHAGRYDDITEVTKEIFKNIGEYEEMDTPLDLEMLWENDRYDGPLCGIAKYNGEYCWFAMVDWDADETQYNLHKLSHGEAKTEIERHRMFQTMVGYHCDHVPGVWKEYDYKAVEDTADDFWKATESWEKSSYHDNEIIGTFSWKDFKYYQRPPYADNTE